MSVLVVFELDHRLTLLEPFQKLGTSQFCAIVSFQLHGSSNFCISVRMRQCSMCGAACFERDNFAHAAQSNMRERTTCVQIMRKMTPAAANRMTTIQGANFHTVSSRKPVSATAKSRGVSTALVHTGW